MPAFIPGLQLGVLFYEEAVRPILESDFPGLAHSAALIGDGSEILGFDTPMSADHHWGPRAMLFLDGGDYARYGARIAAALREKLPRRFRGYSTHFSAPDEFGVQLMEDLDAGPVNHRVEVFTVKAFFEGHLGLNPLDAMTAIDWLTLPEQKLRTVTAGAVYHDGLGALTAIRAKLQYYPCDVWLYLLAMQWMRISQEEPFVGRTGDLGDELGSRILAARLVRDVMKLCFLVERQYAPYSKWFGAAFARLACAGRLTPVLEAALAATTWQEREKHLCAAYEIAAAMHNALGITAPLEPKVSRFHGRPFQVIHGERFTAAIKAAIADETLRHLDFDAGAVDQFIDSTDVTSYTHRHRRLKRLFE